MAYGNTEWAHRAVQPKEAASKGYQTLESAPLCALQSAAHFSDATGRERMWCLDTCTDRGAQLNRHFCSLRSPI